MTSRRVLVVEDGPTITAGTPSDLGRMLDAEHSVPQVSYELREVASSTLDDVVQPLVAQWHAWS